MRGLPPQSFRRVAILATVGLGLAGCGDIMEMVTGQKAASTVRFETIQPQRRTIRQSLELTGRLEPFESTAVHAKIAVGM